MAKGKHKKTENILLKVSFPLKEAIKERADAKEISVAEYIRILAIEDISSNER